MIIEPQAGPQTRFLASDTDITGYGGAAGGGKSWAELIEPLRYLDNGDFRCVIFRRTTPMILNEGGLWEEASRIYPLFGGKPNLMRLTWVFPSGMTIRFAHLQYDSTVLDWHGSQVPLFEFDELGHFTEYQFFYMMSRLRSMSGVKAYVRCGFNPDALSWVKKFFAPWVDDTYPDRAADGEIRYFARVNGVVHWGRTRDELANKFESIEDKENDIKSCTFIRSDVYDNPKMLEKNPGYVGWLRSLPEVERARLLDGDWNIVASAGKIFNRAWFIARLVKASEVPTHSPAIIDAYNRTLVSPKRYPEIRFWDFAATERKLKGKQPDYTVGLKLRKIETRYYIIDVVRFQESPSVTDEYVVETAIADGKECTVRWEQEGGASGLRDSAHLATKLVGYDAQGISPLGDKVQRTRGVASQARAGNVYTVEAYWNDALFTELHNAPDAGNDDQMDALSGAFTSSYEDAQEVTEQTDNPFDYA